MKKKYYIFGILYLVAIIFIMNDTWLYTTPIAKLTKKHPGNSREEI